MTLIAGIIAALLVPFTVSVGLTVWDQKWRGHVVALNLFKGTIASLGFVIVTSVG
jgi:hypothetical protein